MIQLHCYTWVQWCKIFQPISVHTIFPRSFPVRHLSALHFYFLVDFNYFHTVYILKLFSTAFQPINVLVMFLSYTPDITPKFDTIFRIGIILSPCFYSFRSLCTCFWFTWNSWFCLNCEIILNLGFNSSITRFVPFFFTLYLALSSLIFLFPFPPVSPCLSLSSLLISSSG